MLWGIFKNILQLINILKNCIVFNFCFALYEVIISYWLKLFKVYIYTVTYRSFLELTVNTVPLNPKAVTCIGLGLGCRGARSANNRTNTQQLNICYCWTRVGISSSPHIFFSTSDISLCKTVIGFLYWMVLETYSISWGNDSVFFVMLIFWLLLVSSGVNIDLIH